MKEAYYFSHDSNARHDPKITAMRGVYGPKGYAWFWILVEMMRECDSYKLDMQSKYAYHAFASQMQCETEEAHDFINDCINEFGLFVAADGLFWSESLLRRMEKRDKRSEGAKKAAEARWANKPVPDKDSSKTHMQEECERIEDECQSDALKESKGKEIKDKTIVEIVNYLNEKANGKFSSSTRETIKLINGRLGEGRSLEDFKRVIDCKTAEWLGDPKHEQYLRPSTLFRPSNFESYLIQSQRKQKRSGAPVIAQEQPSDPYLEEAYAKRMGKNTGGA
ncbi:conserved phage C-terminal domain-containing protein [Paenibacillus sp. FSL L8-0708]|uniref:conserved phage C-terminal domain-containing protein n=1 Tax=Paenibacillus sp. FSL L8-0708 TaxID=2975311 RepID=UPI0030FB4A74